MMLEDMENDIQLIKRAVKKSIPNVVFTVASDKEGFIEKLNWQVPQIVLSDYHIPGYGGLEAMKLVHAEHPHIPFIFVTGTLNSEESAAKTILKGASGYVLKNNLKILPDVIKKVLENSKDSYEKGEKERQRMRRIHLNLQKIEAIANESAATDAKTMISKLVSDVKEDLMSSKKLSANMEQSVPA